MNCDWVQQNVSLYLYNELADDARHELEQHIQRCKDVCRRTGQPAGISGADECSAGGRAFRQLPGRGRACGCRRRWKTPNRSRLVSPFRFRSYGVAAADAFLARAGGGSGDRRFWRRPGHHVQRVGRSQAGHPPDSGASIAGITSIDRQPNSNNIQIHYDRLLPDRCRVRSTIPKFRSC